MGVTKLIPWQKSADGQDKWEASHNECKLEIHQDADGDWVWRVSNWHRTYGLHEVMGISTARWYAEDHAVRWAEKGW